MEEAIFEAKIMQYDYVPEATVTECEKNIIPWAGKLASYELRIELCAVSNGDMVRFANHRIVRPKWTIFQSHPDRFIPEAADHSLFADQ